MLFDEESTIIESTRSEMDLNSVNAPKVYFSRQLPLNLVPTNVDLSSETWNQVPVPWLPHQ